ncbi:hypothetical protein TcWFU_009835 [Taenia crassiceps]|uniref:Uncharacterized protein n=1 Tax=Taenia crassiceps TaxID=6207 RepID=A0ABR4Q5C9_9CEST
MLPFPAYDINLGMEEVLLVEYFASNDEPLWALAPSILTLAHSEQSPPCTPLRVTNQTRLRIEVTVAEGKEFDREASFCKSACDSHDKHFSVSLDAGWSHLRQVLILPVYRPYNRDDCNHHRSRMGLGRYECVVEPLSFLDGTECVDSCSLAGRLLAQAPTSQDQAVQVEKTYLPPHVRSERLTHQLTDQKELSIGQLHDVVVGIRTTTVMAVTPTKVVEAALIVSEGISSTRIFACAEARTPPPTSKAHAPTSPPLSRSPNHFNFTLPRQALLTEVAILVREEPETLRMWCGGNHGVLPPMGEQCAARRYQDDDANQLSLLLCMP